MAGLWVEGLYAVTFTCQTQTHNILSMCHHDDQSKYWWVTFHMLFQDLACWGKFGWGCWRPELHLTHQASGKLGFIMIYGPQTNMQLVHNGVVYTGTGCTNLIPSLFLFHLLFYFFSQLHVLISGYAFPLSILTSHPFFSSLLYLVFYLPPIYLYHHLFRPCAFLIPSTVSLTPVPTFSPSQQIWMSG